MKKEMGRAGKLALAMCLAGTMMMGGCGKSADALEGTVTAGDTKAAEGTKEAESTDKGYKVLIGCSNRAQSFYAWLADACVQEINANYPDITCEIYDLKGDSTNVPTMVELAETGGYNGIIVDQVDETDYSDLYEAARENGIYTVMTNDSREPNGIVTLIGLNNYGLGHTVGEAAAEKLPKNARLLVIPGPGDVCALDRRDGFFDALKEAGREDVTILAEQNSIDWQKENGMSVMEDWTQKYGESDFDAVYCSNDDLAVGCIEVCAAAGYDTQKLQFYGIDGLANGCNAVKNGTMTVTVLQNCNDQAKTAAECIYNMMTGKDTECKKILLDPEVITSDNVDEIIAMHEANGMLK